MALPMAPGLSLPVSGTGLLSHWWVPNNPLNDPPNYTPSATPSRPFAKKALGGSRKQAKTQTSGPFSSHLPRPAPPLGQGGFQKFRITSSYIHIYTRPMRLPGLSTRAQI